MTPYQPLDDSDASVRTLLQLFSRVLSIRVHGPYRVEVIMKLHPQLNSIFVGHVESGLGIIPPPIFLVEGVEGQKAQLAVTVAIIAG